MVISFASLFFMARATPAAPIGGLFNTGVDGLGAALPALSDDPHYAIVLSPSGGPIPDEAIPADGFPIPPWLANNPTSQWIAPVHPAHDGDGPAGDYFYETTFDMTGLDPTNAFVGGVWGTDDPGPAILLNGVGTTNPASGGFGGLTRFGVSADSAIGSGGGFAPGINSMVFQVLNGGGPTGLRVDEIYGRAAPLGTVRIPGLFPTGVNAAGVTLPDGVDDPHYALVAPGPVLGDTTLPQDGFPIGGSVPPGPWVNNTASSRWISPVDVLGGADGNGPPVVHHFETTFDLTGLVPASAVITGLWSSDNVGVDILLNGVATGNPQIASFPNLNSPFEISTALGDVFLPGVNTLTFVVDNLPPGDNPAGVRVEGLVAWARPIPEPSTVALAVAGALAAIFACRRRAK
jgi:hypothetical protein